MLGLYDNIPDQLKQQPNWVVWGIHGAPLKSPFQPSSLLSGRPQPAKAGINETWDSYSKAAACVIRGLAEGIGYEFGDNGIYGFDLDNVIDEAGNLSPQAIEIVDKLNSYTEISPSGRGLHIYVKADGADITRHRKKGYFLEIYSKGRYFTVTGNIYGNVKAIEPRSDESQSIHDKFLISDTARIGANHSSGIVSIDNNQFLDNIPYRANRQDYFLNIGLERDKIFRGLWVGARCCGNESADDLAIMNKLAYWCNADPDAMIQAFRQSPYYGQKDDVHKKKCQRADYLPNTAEKACATLRSTAISDYERWRDRQRERDYSR